MVLDTRQRLERQPTGAVAELVDRHAQLVQQRQMQVGQRRVLGVLEVTSALQLPDPPPTSRIGRLFGACALLSVMPAP